ncbi:MAG: hypothetical protein O6924_13010 [Alphaproteobacteria bacterium]|nr:hypothetical protein [Alphaproteobacteria bacterium]
MTAKLTRHRALGARILIEFIEATPETTPEVAAGIVKRARDWASDLKPLVAPFGGVAASQFKTLTPMRRHELATVEYCAPRDPRFNRDRVKHAVRVFRFDELFQRIPLTLPKGKGGNQRKYNDGPIVEKARAIRESSGTKNKAAAVRKAWDSFPDLVQGDGDPSNIVKRIAGKM